MQYIDSTQAGRIDSPSSFDATPEGQQRRWVAEIQAAEREQLHWWNQGDRIVRRFEDQRDAVEACDKKVNIFTTNVQIMLAALYDHAPCPEVRRKFDDPNDDVGRVAAQIVERAISQDLDEPPSNFSEVMKQAVMDWLVPGMGSVWLRLHVETTTQNDPTAQADFEVITEEEVIVEHVHWKDLLWSPCRTWEDRRWVARKVYMFKEQVIKRFGADKEKDVSYDIPTPKMGDPNDPRHELFKRAAIYEIWDRQKREVWWINKGMLYPLDHRDDPLNLTMFEPMPKPLFALQSTSNVIPRPDYVMLQDQYRELDTINNRISLLVQACKVVGVYDRANQGVQRLMLEGFDNSLIPVDNWAMFAERGGLKGVLDWLPLETVVQAVNVLIQNREQVKQQIYELTGIADIIRGATKASETLGAQELKSRFASIRIQTRQEELARFATDIFRIKTEMMLKHMQMDTMLQRSGIMYMNEPPQLIQQAIDVIQDHKSFEWRINVLSDSMAQLDYAGEKQDRMELLTTVGGFLQQAVPAMAQEPDLIPIASALIKYCVASFRAGKEIESSLDQSIAQIQQTAQARAQQPPPPNPALVKAQADAQATGIKAQASIAATQAKTQASIAATQQKAGIQRLQLVQQARNDRTDNLLKAQQQHFEQVKDVQDQLHAQAMARQDQAHDQALQRQEQGHDQALAEHDQRHDQALKENQQAHQQGLNEATAAEGSETDKKLDTLMDAMTKMADCVAKMAEAMSAPKRVVRDSTGRAVGMEVV